MFQYFNTVNINNKEVVDIWKNFKIEIQSKDYTEYQLLENDNLMLISFRFYNTIDNWWILYYFNDIHDINFDLLQNDTIQETSKTFRFNILNYSKITTRQQMFLKELIREFYGINNDLITSIKLTEELINTKNLNEIDQFINFIETKLLFDSFYNKTIKIPNINLVKEIKNKLSDFSKLWRR